MTSTTANLANGPELWKAVLEFFPEGAIIAGGCVRDYWLGKEPKDIDVFVSGFDPYEGIMRYVDKVVANPVTGQEYLHKIENKEWRWQTNPAYPSETGAGYLDNESEINYVDDYILDKKWLINIIGLQDDVQPLDRFYQFDLGTTMALFDGNLFYSKQFLDDMMAKTVTIVNETKRTRERARRFVNNNKDFRIVERTNATAGLESG